MSNQYFGINIYNDIYTTNDLTIMNININININIRSFNKIFTKIYFK